MKAVVFDTFGPPEVLQYRDVSDPAPPGPGQVLVAVRAVGVNFHDYRQRLGLSTGASIPSIPGLEMSGIVESVGPDVTAFAPGDRVFGRARSSYAEKVLADAANLFLIPDGFSFESAAVVPVAFLTATHALLVKSPIQPGERLLMQAAGSSVGSAAVQVARREGAWVVGTAGSPGRCARVVQDVGAHAAIDYTREDVPARVMALTDSHGVDVALDGVGTATLAGTLTSLAIGGRALVYGAASGSSALPGFDVATLAGRGLSLVGFSITAEKALFQRTMRRFQTDILPALAQGTLRPMLERTLPLAEAAAAHRSILDRAHFGKLALVVDG